MAIEQKIETVSRVLGFLTELIKFIALAGLASFAAVALANPGWAQKQLKAWNLHVKEINVAGITLAANESFDVADKLVETRISVDSALDNLAAAAAPATATADLKKTIEHLDRLDKSLAQNDATLREATVKAGLPSPKVPSSGWIYVGLLTAGGKVVPGNRIDAKETVIANGTLTRLQLKYDAPVNGNGDDCGVTAVSDFSAPTPEDLQSTRILLRAAPYAPLKVLATAECRTIGDTRTLYARVEIEKDRVRLVRFADIPR